MAITQVPIELSSTPGIVDNSNATAITIDSSENVGIGTNLPTSRLQLDGAEDRTGGLTLSAGGQNHTYFLSSDFVNVHNIETSSSAAAHTWQTNGTERVRIDSSGNVGIGTGTSSPQAAKFSGSAVGILELANTKPVINIRETDVTDAEFFMGMTGGSSVIGTTGNGLMIFQTGTSSSSERMRIDSNGTITQTTSSASPVSANFVTGNSNCDITMNSANTSSLTRLRNGTNDFQIHTNGTERMRITAAGALQLSDVNSPNDINTAIYSNSDVLEFEAFGTNGAIAFTTGSSVTERMRIDANGNVSVSSGTFTASNVIDISTDATVQTTTARQWATIKNTGTGVGDYCEMRLSNNANNYIVFGSIGSNYTSADWSNSSYIYADRELRIKSNNAIRFFSGGFNLNTHDNMVLESSGHLTLKGQIVGGFGAIGTGGTTNWNHSTNARSGMGYTLLLGSAANGPGGGIYYHPVTFEYGSKDGTGNMTQLAIPYTGSSSIYIRTRYSGSWSSWGTV